MRSGTRFLLTSVLFHAILLIAILPFVKKPEPQLVSLPFELELVESKKPTVAEKQARDGLPSAKSLSLRGSSGQGLRRYLPSSRLAPAQDRAGAPNSNGDTYLQNPTQDNPNAPWGSGSQTFGRIVDYNLYRMLYNQIDGALFYPGVLSRHKIKGTVNARIVIAESGDCNWQKTQIRGEDPYLSLYVLDVLKNVCHANFKAYLGQKTLANADLSFRFDINENDEKDRSDKEKLIIGNTLLFYRNSHQSIAEWELGPFHGLFPIPAVYLNIPWIQENWDELVHKKEPLDDFKKEFGRG